MAWQDPAEFWARLQEEAKRNTGEDIELEYMLRTLNMRRSWQTSEEGNVTINEPLHMELYIPPTTKSIKQVILRMKLKPYETYSSSFTLNTADPGQTDYAEWESSTEGSSPISSAGDHDHGGLVTPDGSHSHSIKKHTHPFTIPQHTHKDVYAIFKYGYPKDVRITINGIDVTEELGGPFNEDQESLDLTQYVQAIGWNDIQFSCGPDSIDPPRGRIRASIFVELYLP